MIKEPFIILVRERGSQERGGEGNVSISANLKIPQRISGVQGEQPHEHPHSAREGLRLCRADDPMRFPDKRVAGARGGILHERVHDTDSVNLSLRLEVFREENAAA